MVIASGQPNEAKRYPTINALHLDIGSVAGHCAAIFVQQASDLTIALEVLMLAGHWDSL